MWKPNHNQKVRFFFLFWRFQLKICFSLAVTVFPKWLIPFKRMWLLCLGESPLGCHRWIASTPHNKMCLKWPFYTWLPAQYTNKRLHDFCSVYASPAEFFILRWLWAPSTQNSRQGAPVFPPWCKPNRQAAPMLQEQSCQKQFSNNPTDCFDLAFVEEVEFIIVKKVEGEQTTEREICGCLGRNVFPLDRTAIKVRHKDWEKSAKPSRSTGQELLCDCPRCKFRKVTSVAWSERKNLGGIHPHRQNMLMHVEFTDFECWTLFGFCLLSDWHCPIVFQRALAVWRKIEKKENQAEYGWEASAIIWERFSILLNSINRHLRISAAKSLVLAVLFPTPIFCPNFPVRVKTLTIALKKKKVWGFYTHELHHKTPKWALWGW